MIVFENTKKLADFDLKKVVVLVGPTASGKTSLSVELGQLFPFEIVCMDSMQLYKEMLIGTARPYPHEMGSVTHHLFGELSVETPMNCNQYAILAAQKMSEIQARGRIPLLVGGTGLYFRALFGGLDALPATPPHLRARLNNMREKRGDKYLYRLLSRLDPKGAARLHSNDKQRVQRYLEVRILTGHSILEQWGQPKSIATEGADNLPLTLGLQVPRPVLVDRIHLRTKAMISQGWIEEAQHLQEIGLFDRVCEVGPIGYQLIGSFLAGHLSKAQLVERVSIQTRRYAKRQMTWFRKDTHITWFPFDVESGYNVSTISDLIGNRMT